MVCSVSSGPQTEWTTENVMPQELIDMLHSEDSDPFTLQQTEQSQLELVEEDEVDNIMDIFDEDQEV